MQRGIAIQGWSTRGVVQDSRHGPGIGIQGSEGSITLERSWEAADSLRSTARFDALASAPEAPTKLPEFLLKGQVKPPPSQIRHPPQPLDEPTLLADLAGTAPKGDTVAEQSLVIAPMSTMSIGCQSMRSTQSNKTEAEIPEVPPCIFWYFRMVVKRPCCFVLLYLVLTFGLIAACWKPLDIELDFSSFVSADGDAMRNYEAFSLSKQGQEGVDGRRLEESRRLLASGYIWIARSITVVYVPKDGNGFNEVFMRNVREVERDLTALPGWKRLCHAAGKNDDEIWFCDPGESLVPFAWAEQKKEPDGRDHFNLTYNGNGTDMLPLPALLSLLQQGGSATKPERFFPKDYDIRSVETSVSEPTPPTALRSRFTFVLTHKCSPCGVQAERRGVSEMKNNFSTLIAEEVYPLLNTVSLRGNLAEENLMVYYYGDYIVAHEVITQLMTDILWAGASVAFVTFYMWLYMQRSFILSLGGFFIIIMSVPLAYVLTPASKTTIASFLSLFLVTVIDIDVIFVFNDFWIHSKHIERLDLRLLWTTFRAGKSCLATSITTAVSFIANLASALQALREFGMFIGICVLTVYILALALLPPLLIIQERRSSANARTSRKVMDISAGESGAMYTSEHDTSDRGSVVTRLLHLLLDRVASCPVAILVFLSSLVPVLCYGIVTKVTINTTVPEVFPDWHNQVRSKQWKAEFEDLDLPVTARRPSPLGILCDPSDMFGREESCALQWCQGTYVDHDPQNPQTSCWRGPTLKIDAAGAYEDTGWDLDVCGSATVVNRLVSKAVQPDAQVWRSLWSQAVGNLTKSRRFVLSPNSSTSWQQQALEPLVMENWATGLVELTVIQGTQMISAKREGDSRMPLMSGPGYAPEAPDHPRPDRCEIHTLCFYGLSTECKVSGWRHMGRLEVPAGTRRLSQADAMAHPRQPRLLQGWRSFGVQIVWGVRSAPSNPLLGESEFKWMWDTDFDAANPWAQRSLDATSKAAVNNKNLSIYETWSWVKEFKKYQRKKKRRFPSRNFHKDVADFYRSDSDYRTNLWFKDRKLVACSLEFYVEVPSSYGVLQTLEFKETWDNFVVSRNAEASVTANRAWHTANSWVSAEAQLAIIMSTAETVLVECALGFAGLVVFTGDPSLALLVMTLVLGNIIGLTFFIVVVMGWEISPIEVLFILIFLGYSVTYGLHVAHNYAEVKEDDPELLASEAMAQNARLSKWEQNDLEQYGEMPEMRLGSEMTARELREARTRTAILHVGGAVISCSVSSVGSSSFLLLCTLNIFPKLGAIVICVTSLSIFLTLVGLPAVLIVCGPPPRPCYKRTLDMCLRRTSEVESESDEDEHLAPSGRDF